MALSKKKEQEYIEKVKQDGFYLKRILKNQTREICLEAVKRCGWALEYVENQIGEVCLVALLQDSRSYKYIESPTKEMRYLHSTIQKKWKNGLPSYRVIRSKLTVGEIDLTDSPYHVLDCMYKS